MIIYDTNTMEQLVHTASSVNDNVNSAVQALNNVAIHYDWCCREKDSINSYSINNKNHIKRIQDQSRSFLTVVREVSKEFVTTENRLPSISASVDVAISKIVSISPRVTIGISKGALLGNILKNSFRHLFDSYEWGNVLDTIAISEFPKTLI